MTRPKVSRYTVSSFGPELLTILLKGARERVEIPCEDQREMKFLQMRLQMLRGAMARERHPNYGLVTRARTSRTWDNTKDKDTNCVLVVQPNDSQFGNLLKRAGIAIEPSAQDLLDTPVDDVFDTLTRDEPTVDPYAKYKDGA